MSNSAPLSWHAFVTTWDMPISGGILIAAAALAYLWGVRRAGGWPWRYTAAYLGGLLVAALAIGSSINAYSDVLFAMHMAQHLLLIMVAPTLVLVGRPLTLLAKTSTGPLRRGLVRLRRSRLVAAVTHPAAAFGYYTIVVVGTHLTQFQQGALTQPLVHALEEVLYFTSGFLLLMPVLGTEPLRATMAHLMRLVTMLVSMVVDTIVGVTLMMTPRMPFAAYADVGRTWGPSLAQDLHWGGAMMWVGGDGLMAAVAAIVIARWMNAPSGTSDVGPWLEAARRSALARTGHGVSTDLENSAAVDDDEEALRAYNAMLARLEERERGAPGSARE